MTVHIDFMLFNVKTRRLLENRRTASTIHLVEIQRESGEGEHEGNLDYILGWHKRPHLKYVDENGEVAKIGDGGPLDPGPAPKPAPPPPTIITLAEVRAEAARRLLPTDWMALRASEGGKAIPDDVAAYRAKVRGVSNKVETLDPIPANFAADKRWPMPPEQT